MPSFIGTDVEILADYLPASLAGAIATIAATLQDVDHEIRPPIGDNESVVPVPGPLDAQAQRAVDTENARRALRTALLGAPDAFAKLRQVYDFFRLREFGQALDIVDEEKKKSPPRIDGDLIHTALRTEEIVFSQLVDVFRLDPPSDVPSRTVEEWVLPGYPGSQAEVDALEARLNRLFSYLGPTPERAYRLDLLRADCQTGLDELEPAIAAYQKLFDALGPEQATERRAVALRLGAAHLALGDRRLRAGIADDDEPGRRRCAGSFANAIFAVKRADAGVAADDPARLGIELAAGVQRDKVVAGLNALGYHPSYVPAVGDEAETAESFAAKARARIQSAIEAAQQFEHFKTVAEQLMDLIQSTEFDRSVAIITQQIDADKLEIAHTQQRISELQVQEIDVQIAQQPISAALSVGTGLLAGMNPEGKPFDRMQGFAGALTTVAEYGSRSESLALQREIAVNQGKIAAKNANIAEAEQRITRQRIQFLKDRVAQLKGRELNPDLYYATAETFRELAERHLDAAIRLAFLCERAMAFKLFRDDPPRIKMDYLDRGSLLDAPRLLAADLDDVLENSPRGSHQVLVESYSLRALYPLEFARFTHPNPDEPSTRPGEMEFAISLPWFERRRPGVYHPRIQYVGVKVVALASGSPFTGEIIHLGTFLVRDRDATLAEPRPTRIVPTDAEFEAALEHAANGGRVRPVGGVLPYCLPPAAFAIGPNMDVPTLSTPRPVDPGTVLPIEGYSPAGRWKLVLREIVPSDITDVILHVSYDMPQIDSQLGGRIEQLLAAFEDELLGGQRPDEVLALSMKRMFPDAFAGLGRGPVHVQLGPEHIRDGIRDVRLETIVAQALDRDGKPIGGIALDISREGTALSLRRKTGSDGFTEPRGAEIVLLPPEQRFPAEGTYTIGAPEPSQLGTLGDLILFFLYDFRRPG